MRNIEEYLDTVRNVIIVTLVLLWMPLLAWGTILLIGML